MAGGLLVLAYGLPLFWPPAPAPPAPDGWFLERLYPGVPPAWALLRLVALALGALLLSATDAPLGWRRFETRCEAEPAGGRRRAVALALAVAHAASSARAAHLGAGGQAAYLVALFLPAALLASPPGLTAARVRRAVPVALVIVAWGALRLATDLGSQRVADVVDGWRGFVDIVLFSARDKNVLTDLFDPELPGLGATAVVLHGLPFFRSGIVPLGVAAVQVFQIVWVAITAAGVGLLARMVAGRGVAALAVAVFLFAPYTRLVTLFPGPFLIGPLYATALALAGLVACRRRSEAALAALGALAGLALAYPGVVPLAAFAVALTLWHLRRSWRLLWVGWAAALASFAAAVVPAVPGVLTPARMMQHLRLHGAVALLEPTLLGQLPVGGFALARSAIVWRPLDVVAGALLEPWANPRTSIRLWGDAIVDPVGAALVAIGLATCLRTARRSAHAALLLAYFLVALCPAFVSPVDRVDIVHAVAIPVPLALLAAAGATALGGALASGRARRAVVAVAVVAIGTGGSVLFDVVNPRILAASAAGIMVRAVAPGTEERVVLLDYPSAASPDVRWLFNGAVTAFAGARPVGFLEYGGGSFAPSELASEGKNLLFWSPGLEQDFAVAAAVCVQWPAGTLYEIHDDAHVSRVYAARLEGPDWVPARPRSAWRSWECAARSAGTPTHGKRATRP